jgi:tRNA-dihydrouridine synthase
MIGRAAMTTPWIFRQIKRYLSTGELEPALPLADVWAFIVRHARLAVEARSRLIENATRSSERGTIHSLRARLMAYSRGLPGGRLLRGKFAAVESLAQLDDIAAEHLAAAPAASASEALVHSGTATTFSM